MIGIFGTFCEVIGCIRPIRTDDGTFRPDCRWRIRMLRGVARYRSVLTALMVGCVPSGLWNTVVPEQRCLDIRDPSQLCPLAIPAIPDPETVTNRYAQFDPSNLSLDEAIRVSLANSAVVRVLAGVTAVSSGETVYDPAISNAAIDEARAMFDPNITVEITSTVSISPPSRLNPGDPARHPTGWFDSSDDYTLGPRHHQEVDDGRHGRLRLLGHSRSLPLRLFAA